MTLLCVCGEPCLGLLCVFFQSSQTKKEPIPLQSGVTFFSNTWKEYLFGFTTAVPFLRAAHLKPSAPSFYGMCQWKTGGVHRKGALLVAGFLGNLCCQVQQLKLFIHKEAHFHPAREVVKRN